jgi:hypothetical protein
MPSEIINVSGPVNVVRLEGEIDGNKKVLYLLMDFHMGFGWQLQCNDLNSLPINNYLYNEFKKMKNENETYHFFLETFPDTQHYKSNITGIYINQLRKMFSKLFSYDYRTNKASVNSDLTNIKFHYMDIRSYLNMKQGNPFSDLWNESTTFDNIIISELDNRHMDDLKKTLKFSNELMMVSYNNFYINTSKSTFKFKLVNDKFGSYSRKELNDAIKYIVNKIKNIKNKTIKKNIMYLIDNNLKDTYDKYFTLSSKLIKYIDTSKKYLNVDKRTLTKHNNKVNYTFSIITDIKKEIYNNISDMLDLLLRIDMQILVLITDLYFVRRYLDKDYINNAIIWTGASHSLNYINILVNMFDFKVTHTDYLKNKKMTIDDINKQIKKEGIKILDNNTLREMFWPKTFNQCTDFGKFPKLFK